MKFLSSAILAGCIALSGNCNASQEAEALREHANQASLFALTQTAPSQQLVNHIQQLGCDLHYNDWVYDAGYNNRAGIDNLRNLLGTCGRMLDEATIAFLDDRFQVNNDPQELRMYLNVLFSNAEAFEDAVLRF